jgi:NAD(P)-dependent dehydrogenase (short-subunit alcohol dehydrogenase family)
MWAGMRSAARECVGSNILVNGLIPGPTNTGIWGRDMPMLQSPDVVYPTARMLATLPEGGETGKVFWNEKEYRLMDPANPSPDFRKDVAK